MPNMSYCRFKNTLRDLDECADALGELACGDKLFSDLSDEERSAAKALVGLCDDIVRNYGRLFEKKS